MKLREHIIALTAIVAMSVFVSFPIYQKTVPANAVEPAVADRGTGFWRIKKDNAGVFWFVSPEGHKEFLNCVTTVQPEQLSIDGVSPGYRSLDWKDHDLHRWALKTAERVKSFGFKGIGAWSNEALYDCHVPFTRCLNLCAFPVPAAKRFFSPAWRTAVENAVREQAVPLKNNSDLVGYFSDNELDWTDSGAGARAYFDGLDKDDPNRLEVLVVLKTLWKTPEDFSRDWHVSLSSWNELQKASSLPDGTPSASKRLEHAWISHLSEHYFRVTTHLIRQYDPNHLILGVRFHGFAVTEVVRAARGLTDAMSINIYAGDSRLDPRTFSMIAEESAQPVIISEFSFHALDGTSGNRNKCDFPAIVADQRARADGYRLFTARLARVPYIIGADWFQWMDEPPAGRGDGEDANVGIVDIFDHPYSLLRQSVRETGPTLDALHATSAYDARQEIWRHVAAEKAAPVFAEER